MNKHNILFIKPDTHKEFNKLAYIENIEVHKLLKQYTRFTHFLEHVNK